MRGIVRGIGSVKVAGASCCSSRPSPIPFSWIRANDGAKRRSRRRCEIGGNGDGAVRVEMRHGIVDKKIAIRSAERVQQFCRLCHTHHSLLPAKA